MNTDSTQQSFNSQSEPTNYQSYGDEQPNQSHSDEQLRLSHGYEQQNQSHGDEQPRPDDTKSLERDLKLQEFQDQRDLILKTLAQCIKQKNFNEAQEIYHQYQIARKYDESFASLGLLLTEGVEKQNKISKYELLLEATPDNEYKKRLDYYNEILKIEPNNIKYLELKKQCLTDRTQNQAALNAISRNDVKHKKDSSSFFISIFILLTIISFLIILLL